MKTLRDLKTPAIKNSITGALLLCGGLLACVVAAQTPSSKPDPRAEETRRIVTSLDGSTLYKTYCAVCHGPGAKGDGPMAKMLVAKTPDLTRVAERHGGKFPRPLMEGVISGETLPAAGLPSGHGTREMPVWGPIFSQVSWDTDLGRVRVDNLARYIETLQTK